MITNSVVEQTKLKNGIRIVTERMPFVRSVSIGVWVKAGVVNETPDNNGISHLVEHMLFKGTIKRSAQDIAKSLEIYGGGINGFTTKESSVYTAHVLDEHTELAVDILTDLVQNPKIDSQDLALEKSVVLAEINHSKETPEEFLYDHFYQNVFPAHPIGYFIYGSEANVQGFEKDQLHHYVDQFYTPNRLVFSAAGNIKHSHFVDLVSKYVTKSPLDNEHVLKPLNGQPVQNKVIEIDGLYQAHISMGGRAFGINDDRRYILSLIDILLGGGMSSRLFQNIREKYGFAYSVYSFVEFLKHTGIYGAYLACSVEHIEQSIQLLQNEFLQLAKVPVSADELDQIKSQAKGNILLGLESSSSRMRQNGETEFYENSHLSVKEVLDKIDKITPGDVQQVAAEIFNKDDLCITVIKPTHI